MTVMNNVVMLSLSKHWILSKFEKMKFYFTYILLCEDNSYYTGMTNDLERRLIQHNDGLKKDCYTYKRKPVELKWYLECTNPSEAIKSEKQIKGWSRKKKIALIQENWQDLIEFSKNYTEYGHPDSRGLSSTPDNNGSD